MMTGAFIRNIGKLFSVLKLVTDNLFLYLCSSNWEATEIKWSGEQSQISWAYFPKVVKTNEIVRSVIIM